MKRIMIAVSLSLLITGCVPRTITNSQNKLHLGGNEMDLIQELTEKGYGKQAEMLKQLEKSSIIMTTSKADEDDFSIGESKIGGNPHLPEDFVWPEFNGKSLAFLSQINLSEVFAYDTDKLLPESGILYFFHEGGEEVWGFDPKDKGGFKVIYYTGDISQLRPVQLPENLEDYLRFSPCRLSFENKESYPTDYYDLNQKLFDGDKSNEHDDFFDRIDENSNGVINKMFGYPDLVQGDIFLESQLVTNGLYCGDSTGYNDPRAKELEKGVSEWMLLFQIDSDDNADMMWGDVGRIYFTIKKEDLKNQNFDAVWSVFQCS